jgi:LmbE family N-acetylglucosaminyl deacetylase
MKNVLIIAPHPDDETLGCGGTLLRHKFQGDAIHWLIVTGMTEEFGFSANQISLRDAEIENVAQRYGFTSVHNLRLPTTRLDASPLGDLIAKISGVVRLVQPEVVYLPYRGDVHSDHKCVFDAAAPCTKWFRYGFIKRVLAYETQSETDFDINPDSRGFRPNVFINIETNLEDKIRIMKLYTGETGKFPFPRSEEALRALAALRGSAAGYKAAEAFMLLKEII